MQRNITYQDIVKLFGGLILLLMYEMLSSIYPFLPPLFGLAFLVFIHAIEKGRLYLLFFTVIYLLVFETDKEFLLFSSLVYFVLAYKIGILKLRLVIQCQKCMDYVAIVLAYLGFWVFTLILNQMLWIESDPFDWTILYYIAVESLIVVFI